MGYYGEKVVVFRKPPVPLLTKPPAPLLGKPPPPGQRITTCYSKVRKVTVVRMVRQYSQAYGRDPVEKVDRSNPPLYMKYRSVWLQGFTQT